MSLDRSLKGANALVRHRNVLTRGERLEKLKDEEKWTEQKSVFGLPKVAHRKAAVVGKATKEVAEEGAPAAAGAATAAGAAPAAGAGATAAGGKSAAAPAAKAGAKPGAKAGAAAAAPAKKK